VIAPAGSDTGSHIRALHSAAISVLERTPDASTLSLALSDEFDLVSVVYSPGGNEAGGLLSRIAVARKGLIALLPEATPAIVSTCLHAGADACLQLDAESELVVAQVHAVLRRSLPPIESTSTDCGLLQVGDLTVDIDRCEVARAGEFVPLTASEFRIVEYMARNPGRVLKPYEILNAVSDEYQYLPREAQEVFKVYVRRIRRKLEPFEQEPRYLITVRGFGYRLEGGDARQRAARGVAAFQTA
jgi:DNA-binding response OmpR family regulator